MFGPVFEATCKVLGIDAKDPNAFGLVTEHLHKREAKERGAVVVEPDGGDRDKPVLN